MNGKSDKYGTVKFRAVMTMDTKVPRSRHGSIISMAKRSVVVNRLRIESFAVRASLAEFLSAFVFVFLGEAGRHSIVLSNNDGNMLLAAINGGIAVAFSMYLSGGVSGGFLNPAVTLAWSVVGKLRWSYCLCYQLAQYLGAFTASALVYVLYYDALQKYDGGVRSAFGPNGTAGLYATYPQDHQSLPSSMANEIVASALLLIAALAVSDRRGWRPDNGLFPLVNGLVIVALVMAFYANGPVSMNPSRDLAPRLFTFLAGWGEPTFSLWNYQWFWIPFILPYVGALIGALIYELLIEFHWPPEPLLDGCNEVISGGTEESILIRDESASRRTTLPPISAYGPVTSAKKDELNLG